MEKNFKNDKIMILVPHQDDELNICGGMLTSGYFKNENVILVYSTNGDYFCNYKARIKETNKLIKKLKIPKKNVIYMGYSDQHYKGEKHIYLTHKPDVFTSKKGNHKTFSNNYHYNKYKNNAEFNDENFVNDIKDIINDYYPDVIFTIDFSKYMYYN